ncbi:MAG: F0F1 ATP synthase subunit delta [Gammaproteobacteria bacterium]|nr:F0F1 ATP synthase subunit delta [Gammaproteobacteria bacterium]
MADITTLARPYAKAVFELAQAKGSFDAWQEMLGTLAAIVKVDDVQALLKDPRVSTEMQAEIVIAAAKDVLDDKGSNFVKVLAKYRRLAVLPAIEADFTELRAAAENTVAASLHTVVEATEEQKQSVRDALAKRLGRDVELSCEIDESLIGGALIQAGDLVIDSSVRGKLERLAARVSH